MKKIAISACLLGENVRYNNTNKYNKELIELVSKHNIVSICPEVLGGLSIPHNPCEIKENKVIDNNNNDVTSFFNIGANKALELVKDCDYVILKEKSPSCGLHYIYDGTFTNNLIKGNGIFTRLCIKNKIKVFNEEDLELIRNELTK